MGIKDSLKKFVVGTGGTTSGKSTTELLTEVNEGFGVTINPLIGFTIDTDVAADTDLLGKVIGDLQKDVYVYKDTIEGSLYHVTDYTGFSGDVKEQEGHYLVLHASVPGETGVTIKAIGPSGREVTLDADGILVLRLTNKHAGVTFVASKGDYPSVTREFTFAKLNFMK